MKIYILYIFASYLSLSESYTKYGRSCKDIGCPSNQMCVMQTDPCSYYQRQGECGTYPTCKLMSNTERTCSTYVCPPTKVCKMDGDTPKCVDDHSKVGLSSYDTQNQNVLGNSGHQQPSGIYPNLSPGETTPRPNVYRPPVAGGGYQGGSIGSGYPGNPQSGGYPQQPGGYPGQAGGYPGQAGGYPGQQPGGYQQPARYPQGGYPQGGYPQGTYQGQGGYQPYPGYQGGNQGGYQGYGNQQKSSGSSFTDQITSSLKSIGTDLLKNAITKAISGRN